MPIHPHRRYQQARYEQPNIFSLIFIIDSFKKLWYDHVTPEIAVYAFKSIRDLVFMGIELLTENTMIQVISLLEHNRTPLRDLAEEYLSSANRTFVEFAYIGEDIYQVDTNTVLLLWVLYCFLHGPTGLKVLQKGVRCLTIARAIRVITFSLTILPNPNPMCNFTGPIDPLNLSPGGACNDLLYSGHVIVYTISALAVTILCSLYPFGPFRLLIRLFIWIQVFQRMIRAVVEFHHYSVDMFLGLCVTLLIWHADILYYDLPRLPQPLYPHLKRLLFAYDADGSIDLYANECILICKNAFHSAILINFHVMAGARRAKLYHSDSDRDSDDCEYETNEQRTNERRIEHQLDEFLNKWKKEIQQRTVYGHVINDKQKEQEQEESFNVEEQAKHFFLRASDLEREGKLYDAIKYYRAAMQLVPDIEFRMARKGQQQQQMTTMDLNNRQENIDEDNNTNEVSEQDVDLIDSLQRMHIDDGELSTICAKNFPQQATHVSSLPSEVLIYIFRWVVSSDLDIRSLEQCARVCRGFYICARDPQLWKMICFKTWGVNTGNSSTNINWRHMFINRPHVAFN
ncbi:unnamed protein product, partial [Rotaria sp. Silwood2]